MKPNNPIEIQKVQSEFQKHRLWLVQKFIAYMLPPPIRDRYQFFTIKTADDISMQVWEISGQHLLEQLERFLKLELYL